MRRMRGRVEVRKVWRYSGRHRVIPIEPEWLGGSEYVVLEKLGDGSLLMKPARDVKTDGDAIKLEDRLSGEVGKHDG